GPVLCGGHSRGLLPDAGKPGVPELVHGRGPGDGRRVPRHVDPRAGRVRVRRGGRVRGRGVRRRSPPVAPRGGPVQRPARGRTPRPMGAAFPAVNPTRWWTVTGMRVCWVGAPRSDPEPPMPRRRFRRTHPISDLRQIAWLQKFLILVLIGQLFLWLGFIAVVVLGLGTPGEDDLPFQPPLGAPAGVGTAGG